MRDNLKKHTLHLRAGDWDFIESIFRPNGVPTAVVVRTLVSQFVDRKREEGRETTTHVENLEIDF
jgi:hypothetical protein